ncbi:N2227-domain-containing protein [Choiromyces venosus 120613-1]|uniref:carnosine N-methyltransferase n=1 Tax=Choiromyces venosus 120613-1 TaxID=1336337 RepID=A0A3N4KJS9_9PEZI|nr:N2227-domain-containing protein [Choiromyces venosus 120613-1]
MSTNGVNPDEEEFDPFSDPEELKAITSTLSSFHLYRRAAHQNLTHRRRTSFFALSRPHQELLKQSPINYLRTLDDVDRAIEDNAVLSEAIFRSAVDGFGIDLETTGGGIQEWDDSASDSDLDKVRSTIKQFYRDWSVEGKAEREACYGGIMKELEERFGGVEDKTTIRVLVPGAGLGRLAFDIAVAGYTSQGNEFSYHQLMASNYILNHTASANQHTIHPFISTFSNHTTRASHLRSIQIPDVHPTTLLTQHTTAAAPAPDLPEQFSMTAGDFRQSYRNLTPQQKFNVCATVFFIDTAPNLISYLETIHNLLVDNGVWINFGPLLWHFEGHGADAKNPKNGEDASADGKFELCLDEVLALVQMCGFKLEKVVTGAKTGYVGDEKSMLRHEYEGAFWVAVKV